MWHDHLMYVVTIDQRDSRSTADRVPGLLAALEPIPCAAPFERTAGDEVQGLVEQPAAVRQVLLTALRGGHWHCGVGIGPVDPGSWKAGTRAGRGPAYVAAREAVEAAKDLPGSVAVRVPPDAGETASGWAADCEAVWAMVASLVLDRTDAQWRVVDAVDAADTQAAAAAALDITPSSVTGALRLSRIREERAAYGTLDRLLVGTHDAATAGAASADSAEASATPGAARDEQGQGGGDA